MISKKRNSSQTSMRVISLQSGSNGNCIYVESGETRLLFDAGISGIRTQTRLAEHNIDIQTVDALLISHDHSDHSASMGILHRKFGVPVWTTKETYDTVQRRKDLGNIENMQHFRSGETLKIKELTIETIRTPHDAVDGVVFIVDNGSVRFGVMTDLGHVFADLKESVKSLDAVLIESNYDPAMLKCCDYPEDVKKRIAGKGGHISNLEAAKLIDSVKKRLRWACLGHVSIESNTTEQLLETHQNILKDALPIHIASRYNVSEVFEL